MESLIAYGKTASGHPSRLSWAGFLLLLLSVQSVLLWFDHHPMFFFGDSASYIWTALSGWLPTDRSFVYGFFIRLFAVPTHSLVALVAVQALLHVIGAAVLAYLLVRYFRVGLPIAAAAGILTSIEPLQLLFVHHVMTETLALFIFVFYIWSMLQYLDVGRLRWLCLVQALAVLLISVRFAFIPFAWLSAGILPLLASSGGLTSPRSIAENRMVATALHVVCSLLLLFVFTSAYKHFHGSLQNRPPAYSYDSGFFAMGFVIPLLEPDDFPDPALGARVLSDLRFPLSDRHMRGAHRWTQGGVISRLRQLQPDPLKADAVARVAAFNAIKRRPFAFLGLGWDTFNDYFDPARLQRALIDTVGNRTIDADFRALLQTHFRYTSDRTSSYMLKSPSGRYAMHSGIWIQLLLLAPLGWPLLFLCSADVDQRRKIALMGMVAFMLVGQSVLMAENPTPRYLHTSAWLFCLMAGVGCQYLFGKKLS